MKEIESKYKSIVVICGEINTLTNNICSSKILFFSDISIKVKFTNPELCFHTLISWLYILYHEASGRNLVFITKKILPYKISISNKAEESQKTIHAFRTLLQHQMDFENSPTDIAKKNKCDSWYQSLIKKIEPNRQEDWVICVNELLDSVLEFLQAILSCLKAIAKSEHIDIVIEEWTRLVYRDYSVYDFEKVLLAALQNIGLSGFFDTNYLTKKNIDSWRKELDVLPDDFNFENHAYKIIERFLLRKEIIPIDGQDILSLGIEPGKRIFDLLLKAKEIFYNQPCNKEDLLKSIKLLI